MTTTQTQDVNILVIAPLPPALLAQLEATFTVHNWWLAEDRDALLKQVAPMIRGVMTRSHLGIDAKMIQALPALEIISIFGVGLDATDVEAAHERQILVAHTPNVLSGCVADTALGHMMNVSRRLHLADRYVREGHWLREPFPSASRLHGKVCGIVGLGRVGQEVAKRAAAFDMTIQYYHPRETNDGYQRVESLVELAKASDFLVLTLPGGPKTDRIINADILSALGPNGILVNVARGSVVDTDALVEALEKGQIQGAGLDVFDDEPHVPEALFKFDNVLLTPHLASNTVETRTEMANLAFDNIQAYFQQGQALTPVQRR